MCSEDLFANEAVLSSRRLLPKTRKSSLRKMRHPTPKLTATTGEARGVADEGSQVALLLHPETVTLLQCAPCPMRG